MYGDAEYIHPQMADTNVLKTEVDFYLCGVLTANITTLKYLIHLTTIMAESVAVESVLTAANALAPMNGPSWQLH